MILSIHVNSSLKQLYSLVRIVVRVGVGCTASVIASTVVVALAVLRSVRSVRGLLSYLAIGARALVAVVVRHDVENRGGSLLCLESVGWKQKEGQKY